MKEIKAFEEAMNKPENKGKSYNELGINPTIFWAYQHAKEAENDLIDFDEVIWDDDIQEIAEFFKKENIKEFTISSTFSGLIKTLAAFEKEGIYMNGLTTVKARYTDLKTGEHASIPAIRMEVQ